MRFFTWGSNFGGQLCLGFRKDEEILLPVEVTPFKNMDIESKLISVEGGRDQTFFIFEDGTVYGCGLNNCGQLGKLPLYVPKPTLLEHLLDYKIVHISARNETIYALDRGGSCIGWGSNTDGQLGMAPFDKVVARKPKVICRNASQVSAGGTFVAVVKKKSHRLVTCGSHKFGEIGRVFQGCYRPGIADVDPVATVGCGEFHVLAVTDNGHLYGWGVNTYGQVGIKPGLMEFIPRPTRIETDYEIEPSKVELKCGREHSVLFGKDAQLLTWGRNQYGQLSGTPHEPEYDWKPTLLYEFCHVHKVAVGGNHNVIIHRNKNVHFWGWTTGHCINKAHKHRDPFVMKASVINPDDPKSGKGILIGAGEKHSIAVVH